VTVSRALASVSPRIQSPVCFIRSTLVFSRYNCYFILIRKQVFIRCIDRDWFLYSHCHSQSIWARATKLEGFQRGIMPFDVCSTFPSPRTAQIFHPDHPRRMGYELDAYSQVKHMIRLESVRDNGRANYRHSTDSTASSVLKTRSQTSARPSLLRSLERL